MDNEPYLYLGLYVDDFVYYSQSSEVEKAFEDTFKLLLDVEFESNMQNLFGQKVQIYEEENYMSIFLSQQSTIKELNHTVNTHITKTEYNSEEQRVSNIALFYLSDINLSQMCQKGD